MHRSIDKTTTHFVGVAFPDATAIHNPDTVSSSSALYNLIKIQPLVRKLAIMDFEVKSKLPAEKKQIYILNQKYALIFLTQI